MTLSMWFNEHLGLIALSTIGAVTFFFARRNAARLEQKRVLQRTEPLLRSLLEQHGATDFVVMRDSSKPGSPKLGEYSGSIFQVHLILHSPPDRWFVYIHVQGSEPVLTPISEQRAKLALR